ncbi:transcriptional regulator [Litchfieldella qijiaojingensis]|uniref:Transcriptional regulator n=1 Tax=Litchfieldella qijiaojingensis TaxID=980347 RepID=A0ABQ2YDF1_9GAMM|nr:helix-turn-helix domain-containing protein [Halomonas qijiaojingensis]GGX80713.1 transcriptional regulator [Halomonas qijiaojingensis]
MHQKRIAILAYDGCLAMEVCAVSDLLLLANRIARAETGVVEPPFLVEIVGVRRRKIAAAGGIGLSAGPATGKADLLVVPGLDFGGLEVSRADLAGLAREVEFIRRTFARGLPVASVCVGAFLLAEAGLLDGRQATTAWLFAPLLARLYPAVEVTPEALLLEDAGVTTAGAFSAATDLALHIVRTLGDADLARKTASIALVEPLRSSQAPFVDRRLLPVGEERFSTRVQHWLTSRFDEPYDLARLAEAFHVSPRTLLRRFKKETGTTPLAYLQRHRVQVAKDLLQSTSLNVAQITERVGYADVATFCSLFNRQVQLSPTEYRYRFADCSDPGAE